MPLASGRHEGTHIHGQVSKEIVQGSPQTQGGKTQKGERFQPVNQGRAVDGAKELTGTMNSADEDSYVFDEASGEWINAAEAAAINAAADGPMEVRDAVGNLLADGDQVTLIKDLTVKGAGQTLKRGTLIKSIRLTGDAQEIDCRFDGIKGLVLRAEFVKKR